MNRQYLLGFDVGSSSVKASLVDISSGQSAATAFFPEKEAPIMAVRSGWAEQEPESWWQYAGQALRKQSRVNAFAHVNHTAPLPAPPRGGAVTAASNALEAPSGAVGGATRLGVLLCINGTGILNAWMHRNVTFDMGYAEMNSLAAQAPIGSDGVCILPFGNGAERVLENKEIDCSIRGLNFNNHSRSHLVRAAQEGIVFSFCYGMEVMQQMGMDIRTIHAGRANMFLSPLFRDTLASVSGATIELYETDGSVGAAKGAGMGAGIYRDHNEAFATLERLAVIEPDAANAAAYAAAYAHWKEVLLGVMSK